MLVGSLYGHSSSRKTMRFWFDEPLLNVTSEHATGPMLETAIPTGLPFAHVALTHVANASSMMRCAVSYEMFLLPAWLML